MSNPKTNSELAKEKNCTPRQISKSRKRGWITALDDDGNKVMYRAPKPIVK